MRFLLATLFSWVLFTEALRAEETLAIIKPDAVVNAQNIISYIKYHGLEVKALKLLQLTKEEAENFYSDIQNRSYFHDFTNYMSSGPVIVMVLESENAVQRYRELMGTTDPLKAAPGTIRQLFGTSRESNAVHGSDSLESAKEEISFFFKAPPQYFTRTKLSSVGVLQSKVRPKVGAPCLFVTKQFIHTPAK